jgi:putative addiction module killer protein
MEIKQTTAFQKWESKLKDRVARAAIAARIFRLANGLPGDVTPVGQGINELRIHYGPGYRVYFQQRETELIILLYGGNKSSQQRDIKLAKHLANEWKES